MNFIEIIKKKSPNERFLLVLGIVLFLLYFVMGIIIIFWKNFPFRIDTQYRIAFGVLLIVYSFLRFVRLMNSNKN
jgi:uncharacterized membrane protein (DUF485 family)